MSKGTAFIIGAGPGLGRALAHAFSTEGHPVALFARDADRAERYAAELRRAGYRARGFRADAADAEGLSAALELAAGDLGAPEVMVYNAVMTQTDTPTEADATAWGRSLAVNVTGAAVAARTVLPLLRGERRSLLFTGGALALQPSPQYATLSVGKAALRAYVQALHADLAETGVLAATVTIAGSIGGPDPRFAPQTLAGVYLDLHHRPSEQWQAELVYT
ncbi:SDR family NAD(P)-dependent oxidoreductase [Glycomyces sp. NPDC047369]